MGKVCHLADETKSARATLTTNRVDIYTVATYRLLLSFSSLFPEQPQASMLGLVGGRRLRSNSPVEILACLSFLSQRRSSTWTRASGRTSMSSRELWNCSSVSFPSRWCPTTSSAMWWTPSVSGHGGRGHYISSNHLFSSWVRFHDRNWTIVCLNYKLFLECLPHLSLSINCRWKTVIDIQIKTAEKIQIKKKIWIWEFIVTRL